MEIRVTNLPWSHERRKHMEAQFNRLKLPYGFVSCVIGNDLTDSEISTKCNIELINKQNSNNKWFTKNIIGCTLTNQSIYRELINSDFEYLLFLEDDTLLPDDLKNLLEEIVLIIKPGDVFLLFFVSWVTLRLRKSGLTPVGKEKFFFPENPDLLTGGSAYIVTKQAAQKMLDLNTPIHVTPDSWGYFYKNGAIDRLLCVYPNPIDTADFRSTMRLGKLDFFTNLIDVYKIFPFYQILKMRRNFYKRKKKSVEIID